MTCKRGAPRYAVKAPRYAVKAPRYADAGAPLCRYVLALPRPPEKPRYMAYTASNPITSRLPSSATACAMRGNLDA